MEESTKAQLAGGLERSDRDDDEFVTVVDRLISRLDELEARIAALEKQAETQAPAPIAHVEAPEAAHPLTQLSGSARLVPAMGRMFLGIAGAYLLRALEEMDAIPHLAVAALGMVYVFLWLWQAARTGRNHPGIGGAYAATAALIFSPMLWELTLRFKVIPATGAAAALVLFVGAATALSWKNKLAVVAAPPTTFAVVLAAALFIQTRAPLPFTVAVLIMALIMEVAAHTGRWPGLRIVPAVFADLALVAMMLLYLGRGAPEYEPIAPAVLLALFAAPFLLYSASTLVRTAARGEEIGIFDVGQTVAAFLLVAFGSIGLGDGDAARAIGWFCLAAAGACYLLAFTRFENPGRRRNQHVFSAWAAAFLLAGTFFCFSSQVGVVVLGCAALAATWAGLRSGRFALAAQGVVFAAAGGLISGWFALFGRLMIGDAPSTAGWLPWVAGAFAILSYGLTWVPSSTNEIEFGLRWPQKMVRLALAALAAGTLLSLAMTAGMAALGTLIPPRMASLRTVVLCILALALGWSGARFRRVELSWLAYAAIALCTVKLLFEDLRAGSAGAIAFSLFCYGMCWLVVPRFARSTRTE